ncbi:enteropeptidase [Loa loa]|uniref:Enteropeptidase n=1 Tax=Loa loa TaxID=7209 RepID=A0A1S0TM09_LOALO|nr:enteropeptidase [Loa loa]EFO15915.1 enteropeptidase [Loa loa]
MVQHIVGVIQFAHHIQHVSKENVAKLIFHIISVNVRKHIGNAVAVNAFRWKHVVTDCKHVMMDQMKCIAV